MSTRVAFTSALRVMQSSTDGSMSTYVMLPDDAAEALVAAAMAGEWLEKGRRGHFGSAKVTATIGATSWASAVYPEKASGGWFLPVRKTVRDAERLIPGAPVLVTLAL